MKSKQHQPPYHFTKEEDDFLRKNYRKMTYVEIAKELGRSHASVSTRARRIGLSKLKLTKNEKAKILNLRRNKKQPYKDITEKTGVSEYKIQQFLKSENPDLLGRMCKPGGWAQGALLEGFNYNGNRRLRDRQRVLYAYNYTCWDCKRELSDDKLVMHHNFNELPVKVLALCDSCHKERHGVNDRINKQKMLYHF